MIDAGALAGVRVLDISRLLPGPYCSMILADHGAEVISVEDRRFEADGLYFSEIYRNKRHMTLNLKSSEGLSIFTRLASEADIILEGFRPGVVKKLGVDYQTLKKDNPRLIYCSITGYGQTGPRVDEPGHDVNYLATAGLLDLMGEKGAPPSIPAIQIADIAGGAMQAVIGILLALHNREKSGEGQYIDISMTDGILGLLTLPRFFKERYGEIPARSDMTLSHRYGCYNTYETADARFIAIGAVENRFWKVLCEHLGRPEYAALQYDRERRKEIISWLRTAFAAKKLAEWEAELSGLNICFSPVASFDEVMNSDLFKARDMVCEQVNADGEASRTFGVPVKLSRSPGSLRTPPGAFGEHTREILAELGYSETQIVDFFSKGVI